MSPSTLERLVIAGPAGNLETDINDPGKPRRGIALIAHPNPVQGGTKDNKVVTTLAKTLFGLGYVAVRPNFRGVGASAGTFDEGNGETEDLLAVANHVLARYDHLPLLLAGFSFGAFVQTRVAQTLTAERLILVGPAVNRFSAAAVPADTLVVHGEVDDVVPLADVMNWARPQNLPLVVVPGGEHFFHGRLHILASIVQRHCA
ncbi:MAG: alpha/beta hydrolase [Betaproteobacteria bacterium]|nr:alpha/beta hydrolase [Betaproteobacteria bacterium]MDH5342595.1 alpha/beta hydrolase [Betaproteobacteria bacterium]